MVSLSRHKHHQTIFVAIALAALMIVPLTFVFKVFAQVTANNAQLTVAIVAPTSGQVFTSGSVRFKANVFGATSNTVVTFFVSGGQGTTRTFPATPSTIVSTTTATATEYVSEMPLTAADNGTYQVMVTLADAPTQRTAQAQGVSFMVAFPQQTFTTPALDIPQITLTSPTTDIVTAPLQLGAQTSIAVTELHFELLPIGGSTVLSYPGNASNGGLLWSTTVEQASFPAEGVYEVRAVSFFNGTRIESAPHSIKIGTAGTGTALTNTDTSTTAFAFAILSVAPESGKSFSPGSIPLQVVTNQPAGEISAHITKSTAPTVSEEISEFAPSSDGMTWNAAWLTGDAPSGTYIVTFTAVREGVEKTQATSFTLKQASSTTIVTPAPTVLSAAWVTPTAQESIVVGTTTLSMAVTGNLESAGFLLEGGPNGTEQYFTATVTNAGTYVLQWDSRTLPNGKYEARGTVKSGSLTVTTPDERIFLVQNKAALTDTVTTPPVIPFVASFMSPAPNSEVSGIVTIAVKTSLTAKSLLGYVSGASSNASTITTRLSPSYNQGEGLWLASWTTTGLNAGDYRISIIATSEEGRTSDAVMLVRVEEQEVEQEVENEIKIETEVETKTEVQQPAVVIKLIEPLSVSVSGPVKLVAATEGAPDGVNFLIRSTAPGSTEITRKASVLTAGRWGATISEGSLTPGKYIMIAVAFKNNTTARSAPGEFTVAAPVKLPITEEKPEAERPLEVALVSPNGGTLHGVAKFSARTNVIAKSVRFAVLPSEGTSEVAVFEGAYQQESGLWVAIWNSTMIPDGTYRIVAAAARGTEQSKSAMVVIGIENEDREEDSLQTVVPVEAVRQSVLEVPAGTEPLEMERSPEAPDESAREEAAKNIIAECAERGIADEKCQAWLATQFEARECRAAGIATKEECLSYLKNLAGGELLECRGLSQERCAELEQRKTAGLLTDEQLEKIDAAITDHINTVITLTNDAETKRVEAASADEPDEDVSNDLTDVIPLRPTGEKKLSLRVHASPAYAQTSDTESARRVPAVIFLDSDEDGLPDDLEKRLGTDPLDADSDDDGFGDGSELREGYNPLGSGKIGADADLLAPIDAAIIAGLPIEQPTELGEVSEDLGIDTIESTEDTDGVRFEGTGVPGEVVSIFIYSYLPVVLTTTVGEDGTWAYDLDDALVDGQHEAYVTVSDSTGQIQKKGNPLSFFIAEAKAASEDTYFGPDADLVASAEAPVSNLYRYYLLGALVLILVAGILGVLVFRKPKGDIMAE